MKIQNVVVLNLFLFMFDTLWLLMVTWLLNDLEVQFVCHPRCTEYNNDPVQGLLGSRRWGGDLLLYAELNLSFTAVVVWSHDLCFKAGWLLNEQLFRPRKNIWCFLKKWMILLRLYVSSWFVQGHVIHHEASHVFGCSLWFPASSQKNLKPTKSKHLT